jgi:uncharacterized paraquat-inducible protein A
MPKKKMFRLRIGISARFKVIKLVLLLMVLSFLLNCYISYQVLGPAGNITIADMIPYTIFQLNYAALIMVAIITIVWILHYGFGALSRMENILDQIISGDYSFRMHLRKHDLMRPFAEKLNKVLDQLEDCKGGNK